MLNFSKNLTSNFERTDFAKLLYEKNRSQYPVFDEETSVALMFTNVINKRLLFKLINCSFPKAIFMSEYSVKRNFFSIKIARDKDLVNCNLTYINSHGHFSVNHTGTHEGTVLIDALFLLKYQVQSVLNQKDIIDKESIEMDYVYSAA